MDRSTDRQTNQSLYSCCAHVHEVISSGYLGKLLHKILNNYHIFVLKLIFVVELAMSAFVFSSGHLWPPCASSVIDLLECALSGTEATTELG